MTDELVRLAEQHRYDDLFRKQLRWGAPDVPPTRLTLSDNQTVTVSNVSTYKGIRVWVCDTMPGAKAEAEIDRILAAGSTDRLVIFHGDTTGTHADEQVWRWPVRHAKGHLTSTRLARHRHRNGAPESGFAHRLTAIRLPADTVLDATEVLTRLRKAFDVEQRNETKQASQLMAAMYAAMERSYPGTFDPKRKDHEISATLARILFLLFGDDTEMWQTDGFRNYILQHTANSGKDIQPRLQELFDGLNDPAGATVAALPYVNGGIFRERITLQAVGADFRTAILNACIVDWSTISPAIFGSMFQSVRDAATRRALGEHYTSEENILKTLNPLFLDELRSELDEAKTAKALNGLWDRLGRIRFMDPACGCGNFIIVAYRELRDLELQIMERLKDLRYKNSEEDQLEFEPTLSLKVTLDHFHGIEIDEWPARIAETAMFLIDRQCDLKLKERFGEAPQRLPIQRQARIEVANALTAQWDSILEPGPNVVIAGNPPFLGHDSRSIDQTKDLKRIWATDKIGRLDYVTGWFVKTMDYFKTGAEGRWAFVATNSICQGEPVEALFSRVRSKGWRIRFAHRRFRWESDAPGRAGQVTCVIIGFDKLLSPGPRLFEFDGTAEGRNKEVMASLQSNINPYLVKGPWVMVRQRSSPLSPELSKVSFGSRPNDGGALIIKSEDYPAAMKDKIASRYVRAFVGTDELIKGKQRWCLWLKNAPVEDLENSPFLRERLAVCRLHRQSSARSATRDWANRPHLFDFDSQPSTTYLCIPGVFSEKREFFTCKRFPSSVITSNLAYTAIDPEGLVFAFISSRMFLAWQQAVGGALEIRPRFTNTIVWNNFPVPQLAVDIRESVIRAGRNLEDARARYQDVSLATLYRPGQLPADLLDAHDRLDAAVDASFGLGSRGLQDTDRISVLLNHYALLHGQGVK